MTVAFWLSDIASKALEALFPLECLACGREGAHVCAACLAGVSMSPREPEAPEPFSAAFCAYAYARPLVRTLIGDYKYRGILAARPAIRTLVRRSHAVSAAHFRTAEIVIPIPLHERRLRERGFNQAGTIAEELAAMLGKSLCTEAVARCRETRPQADPETDRSRNMRDAFAARSAAVRGRSVLLVDDVWTTGATMRACAQALLAAGARDVRGFALAWGSGDLYSPQKKR